MIVNINSSRGAGKLTKYGKQLIAQQMYKKGRGYIFAALLLKKQEVFGSVVTQLLLHGLENILKGGLLLADYEKYKPLLKYSKKKADSIGHNLEKAFSHFEVEFHKIKRGKKFDSEIKELNKYYQQHFLRYGGLADIFLSLDSLKHNWTFKMAYKIITLLDKKRS